MLLYTVDDGDAQMEAPSIASIAKTLQSDRAEDKLS